jgi:hypothetical protein
LHEEEVRDAGSIIDCEAEYTELSPSPSREVLQETYPPVSVVVEEEDHLKLVQHVDRVELLPELPPSDDPAPPSLGPHVL